MWRRLALATLLAACATPAVAHAEPLISRTCDGSADCGGWFRAPVALNWTVSAGVVVSGCTDVTLSQDTPGRQEGCIAKDDVDTVQRTVTVRIDRTPPVVTAAVPARPPDHRGWYTHPVTFGVEGSDVTSGVSACDAPSYSGPDSAVATIVAGCVDRAGNAAARAFPLSYDATPPDPGTASATAADRVVRLSWPGGATATIRRAPGLGGAASAVLYNGPATTYADRRVRNGRRYRYVVTLTDDAGNAASRELAGVPGPRLLAPERRAAVSAPPRLAWTPVRGTRYYNVQLFRGARKVLSAWPRRAALQLEPAWRFHGRQRRLRAGLYRWFVWPGEGRRPARRYGKLIGRRSFTVAPGPSRPATSASSRSRSATPARRPAGRSTTRRCSRTRTPRSTRPRRPDATASARPSRPPAPAPPSSTRRTGTRAASPCRTRAS